MCHGEVDAISWNNASKMSRQHCLVYIGRWAMLIIFKIYKTVSSKIIRKQKRSLILFENIINLNVKNTTQDIFSGKARPICPTKQNTILLPTGSGHAEQQCVALKMQSCLHITFVHSGLLATPASAVINSQPMIVR